MSIIEVKNISKKYRISHRQDRYIALRDVLTNIVKKPFNFLKRMISRGGGREDFWALRNISFNVEQGETLGIIGANGAGKSTLLKIISQITTPTEGEIKLRGRVASLLEVGTGFHPELTGRENVFLSGAILGMTKKEIIKKFDEIVEFSGVEKFLDTPVKRFSSGMYVRLAFAVAAHMDPDILLVDEVLAVGDAAFQEKCLGKMEEVTKKTGRTILFVSHNMAAIQNLCKRCILLERGRIKMIGEAKDIVAEYLSGEVVPSDISLKERKDRIGNQIIRITGIEFLDRNGDKIPVLRTGQHIKLVLNYKSIKEKVDNIMISFDISSRSGEKVTRMSNIITGERLSINKKIGSFICEIPKLQINFGKYICSLQVNVDGKISDYIVNAFGFEIEDGGYYKGGQVRAAGYGTALLDYTTRVED